METYNLVSFAGVFVLLILAWLLSADRRNLNWRVIGWGIGLQMGFALFIFVFPAGTKLFLFVNDVVVAVLDSATAGARFVFGRLALPPGTTAESGETSLGFILAFQALPTIIFFAALMSILYFLKIMPRIIRAFAFLFTRLMRISGAESLSASSNIFVGVESVLTIKPYLNDMTRSELCTVLTAGMATVSSNVLAVYVFSLQDQFPTIAGHLVSASFLSAPAALVMSKIILPEREKPKTLGLTVEPYYERESNLFEAIINGANNGVKLIVGIVALLLAVLGLVALADLILGGLGGWINSWLGIQIDWSLPGLLGYLFYPITLILGIPPADAGIAAKIIGERVIVTELTSYQDLNIALEQGLLIHPRSAVIITYALCGFAHLASLAIFIGGVVALAPKRTTILAQVGFRALLAATLACLLTACVAGTFFNRSSLLLG
ncbi:MAG: nucleoside transporter [candidate division Zixibacteria bacterium]|nr:nucleoside transporter [candidate division Zixibacteria bacterium]